LGVRAHFWDTNLFIYLIEQDPNWFFKVESLSREMIKNKDSLVTSTLTLGEVLVKPIRDKHFDLERKYREILANSSIPTNDERLEGVGVEGISEIVSLRNL
jgi:predicted nucleic acid-binding protein